jgi:hypothetical protein
MLAYRARSASGAKTMPRTGLYSGLWIVFALLILGGGYAMLRACDLGILPLFGSSACAAPPADTATAAERERQEQLRAKLHTAEIRLAQLPICPPPPAPKPLPKPKPVILPDPPPPEPKKDEPKKDEPKKNDPEPVEKFEIPKNIADLKGCWQSVRGDITVVADNAEHTPVGTGRFCYCFGSDGHGMAIVRFSKGDVCRGPLVAKIEAGQVLMRHERLPCAGPSSFAPFAISNIVCGHGKTNETTCEQQSISKFPPPKRVEQFMRVSDEHCGWSG